MLQQLQADVCNLNKANQGLSDELIRSDIEVTLLLFSLKFTETAYAIAMVALCIWADHYIFAL